MTPLQIYIPGARAMVQRAWRWATMGMCVFGLLAGATPNSKELAAIYLIPKITQNQDLQEIAGNGLDIVKELTNNYLQDLKERK